MSKSTWMENDVLNTYYGAGAATVWLALYSSDPTDADSGTELSGGGYARLELTPGTDITVSGNAATNPNDLEFGESAGSQGNAAYFGLRTASTGGNLLHHGALSPARNVDAAGIVIRIPAGDLDITED